MNWVIGIILDLILVAIVFISFKRGSKDGFAKTVVGFLGVFIALILAGALCKPVANFTYKGFVQKPVESTIENTITGYTDGVKESALSGQQMLEAMDKTLENYPEFIKKAIGLDEKKEELLDKINEVYTADIGAFAHEITEEVVKPPVISVVSAVAFIVLFLIISLLCTLLSKSLKLVNKIPLLGSLNSLLGGIIGALKGIIVVVVLNWLLTTLVGDSGSIFGVVTADTIQSSLIMKNLAVVNPLNKILAGVMASK